MVHISGFKRCLFPRPNLPRAQAVPPLCLSRPSLSVQGSTIWPIISTENLRVIAAALAPLQLHGIEEQSPDQTSGGFPGSAFQFHYNGSMSYSAESRQPGEGNKSLSDKEGCDSPQGTEIVGNFGSRSYVNIHVRHALMETPNINKE